MMIICETELEYFNGVEWHPWPCFAVSLFQLGSQIADLHQKDRRVVIGLILPTRASASSLLAAGVVIRRALGMESQAWLERRFEYFWDLPDKTGCYIFVNGTRFRGAIESRHEDQLGPYRKVRYGKTGYYKIYAHQAHHVQPLDRSFHLKGDPIGTTIEVPKFLGETLDYLKHPVKQWSSRLECLLIGNLNNIQADLELPVRSRQSLQGRLQDLLLPKKIEGDGLIYHSDLISPFVESDKPLLLMPETVVVMDGSAAFLEAAEEWPKHDLVVLFDPHDSKFAEAVAKLNGWWESSVADLEPEALTHIPAGAEATAFIQRGGDD